jgi:hypothetical protein
VPAEDFAGIAVLHVLLDQPVDVGGGGLSRTLSRAALP